MNDLKTHLDRDGILRLLYADDLQIYIHVPIYQINHGLHLLSEASCKVSEWTKQLPKVERRQNQGDGFRFVPLDQTLQGVANHVNRNQ